MQINLHHSCVVHKLLGNLIIKFSNSNFFKIVVLLLPHAKTAYSYTTSTEWHLFMGQPASEK